MKILCVDDEPLMLQMLELSIQEAKPDAEVFAFEDQDELLEEAKKGDCDIAFLDIHMRGMTGVELAKELKKVNPKMNIIFVTGFSEYAGEAMKMHASGYIMKPVTKEKVEEERFRVVARVVGRQDGLVAVLPAQLAEPAVAELPRGHLDADAFRIGEGFRVERLHVAGHAVPGRPGADERLVGVAVGAPEAEVAVRNGKRSAFPANLFCQDHRVPATADGDEDHGLISCW